LRDTLLADLRAAMPVDIVLLGLHGAMVAEGCDDCEGDLLARVRAIVGESVVIGAELDPHAHLSQAMVDNADLLLAFREYPHTDALERGLELVDLCVATARKQIRPVAAVHDCGMLATLHTPREPMRSFVDGARAREGRDGIVSISTIHGFPWADVPQLGTRVLVYADGDRRQAEATAQKLGEQLVEVAAAMRSRNPSLDEAIDQALASPVGPVVIADGADNAGGGAPSDSTFVLRRLIERGVQGAVLGPLWDPGAVAIAFAAGEGAVLPLRIGGKIAPVSGAPLDADVTVMALVRRAAQTGLSGSRAAMGDSAWVRVAGVDVVLTSRRNQAFNTNLFTQFGIDLGAAKLIVVKSSQHFYADFSKIAAQVIYADVPGTLTADLTTLTWKKARPQIVQGY
jgi:microcystin degradation protein MlrC